MTIFQYPKCAHGQDYGTCHICEGASADDDRTYPDAETLIAVLERLWGSLLNGGRGNFDGLKRDFTTIRTALAVAATEREKIAVLERDSTELLAALEALLGSAVTLSRGYLELFRDKPLDATIQGWDKARWLRAADAADQATAVIAQARKLYKSI